MLGCDARAEAARQRVAPVRPVTATVNFTPCRRHGRTAAALHYLNTSLFTPSWYTWLIPALSNTDMPK
jgi:hypothetical protein